MTTSMEDGEALLFYFVPNTTGDEKGLYVYKMHNIVEKHFITSIAPVRSRSGSLINIKIKRISPVIQECQVNKQMKEF
jgi:hypothetical protein